MTNIQTNETVAPVAATQGSVLERLADENEALLGLVTGSLDAEDTQGVRWLDTDGTAAARNIVTFNYDGDSYDAEAAVEALTFSPLGRKWNTAVETLSAATQFGLSSAMRKRSLTQWMPLKGTAAINRFRKQGGCDALGCEVRIPHFHQMAFTTVTSVEVDERSGWPHNSITLPAYQEGCEPDEQPVRLFYVLFEPDAGCRVVNRRNSPVSKREQEGRKELWQELVDNLAERGKALLLRFAVSPLDFGTFASDTGATGTFPIAGPLEVVDGEVTATNLTGFIVLDTMADEHVIADRLLQCARLGARALWRASSDAERPEADGTPIPLTQAGDDL